MKSDQAVISINEKKQIRHRLYRDVIPTVLSLVLTGLYSVVDGLFVGNATGDTGLAAINIAWPVTAIVTAAGTGIGTGGSILFSYNKGAGQEEAAERYFQRTLWLLSGMGIMLTVLLFVMSPALMVWLGADGEVYVQALAYARVISAGALFQVLAAGLVPLLRNRALAPVSMAATIISMVANCILNYIFMFKMDMGIQGAATGTVAAQLLAMMISFAALIRSGYRIEKQSGGEHLRQSFGRIARMGIAAFGLSIAPSVVLVFTNWQCLKWGGAQVVAAYAVISYIVFPVQSVLTGLGDGAQPFLSYYSGLGAEEKLIYIKRFIRILIGVAGILLAGAAVWTAPRVPELFGMSADSSLYYEYGIKISALAFLLMGFVRMNMVVLNAGLKVKAAMALVYVEMLVVSPLMILVLPAVFGVEGIWLSLPMTFLLSLLLQGIYLSRRRRPLL